MPKVFIDGSEIEVPDGLNVIQAAKLLGIEIPHFCYHPGLGVDGNCRLCLVEVDGAAKPQVACNTLVRDGLKVRTSTESIRSLRRAVLEFFFLNHPLDCPICDQSGECLLQDFYMRHGQYESRLDIAKIHKRKVVAVGPRVILDAERCVLCRRCVRFCDKITGTGELRIVNRGSRSEITVMPGKPLDNPYSLNTVDLCPVGALTSRDFRFKCRVWFLSSARSICTGCARGCNIYLDHCEGITYRYRPRENQAVNQWWLCDEGRMTYKALNDGRCEIPMANGAEVTHDEACRLIAERLGEVLRTSGPESIAVLLSPELSNESLYAARSFAGHVLGVRRVWAGSLKPPGVQDAILRRSDPHPNRAGCEVLGLWVDDIRRDLSAGGRLLLLVQNDLVDQDPSITELLRRFDSVVCFATHLTRTTGMAGIVHPVTPHAESDGTFTNFQWRVQRFRMAMPPRGDALTVMELCRRIARLMGREFGWINLNQIWAEMSQTVPGFAGMSPSSLGDQGMALSGRDGQRMAATTGERPS